MKFNKSICISAVLMASTFSIVAQGAVTLAVGGFKDKIDHGGCSVRGFFGKNLGRGLQTMLLDELATYDEINLKGSGDSREINTKPNHQMAPTHADAIGASAFTSSERYLVSGTVNVFEMCTSGSNGQVDTSDFIGVDNSGLILQGEQNLGKVELKIWIKDLVTNKVVKVFRIAGEASAADGEKQLVLKPGNFTSDRFRNSVIGQAMYEAVLKASQKVAKLVLPVEVYTAYQLFADSKNKRIRPKRTGLPRGRRMVAAQAEKDSGYLDKVPKYTSKYVCAAKTGYGSKAKHCRWIRTEKGSTESSQFSKTQSVARKFSVRDTLSTISQSSRL